MIVSLDIFSIVAVVALGALMKIVNANKKAQSLMSAMTNINFALESMSREMRVGSNFYCNDQDTTVSPVNFKATGCPYGLTPPTSGITNGAMIAFKSSKVSTIGNNQTCNLIYAYRFALDNGRWDIKKAAQSACDVSLVDNNSGSSDFTSIIDKNVIITDYYVKVTQDIYPLATIRISGYVGAREQERTYFDVQTAISARIASD
jgi:type II secretory pathway pseudopilin PulG